MSERRGKLWTYEELRDLKKAVNAEGLELEAIENLDPSHWYDILLDGPPMPEIRGTARLVYRPELYQRLLNIHPSRSNAIEFCQGTTAEMADGDF